MCERSELNLESARSVASGYRADIRRLAARRRRQGGRMSIKSADELNAYYAKDYKKLNRLVRKLKFDLGYCLDQSDDTTLDDLLDASWGVSANAR